LPRPFPHLPIGGDQVPCPRSVFLEKLEAEVTKSPLAESWKKTEDTLGPRPKDGVPAPDVRDDGMLLPGPVPETDRVTVARAAAAPPVCPVAQEGGKHAVLRVEEREVVMEGDLDLLGSAGGSEGEELVIV
jgi:hypothetical protein